MTKEDAIAETKYRLVKCIFSNIRAAVNHGDKRQQLAFCANGPHRRSKFRFPMVGQNHVLELIF